MRKKRVKYNEALCCLPFFSARTEQLCAFLRTAIWARCVFTFSLKGQNIIRAERKHIRKMCHVTKPSVDQALDISIADIYFLLLVVVPVVEAIFCFFAALDGTPLWAFDFLCRLLLDSVLSL